MQQIELSKQSGPSQHDLCLLRDWLNGTNGVEGNQASLRGSGCQAWKPGAGGLIDTENDYVVLSSKHKNRDRFERWAGDTLLGIYHRLIGCHFKVWYTRCGQRLVLTMQKMSVKDEELGLAEYDDAKISVAADITCTIFAPLLTTIPMFVLYFAVDVKARLGIIMGFTTLFSIRLVSLITRRHARSNSV